MSINLLATKLEAISRTRSKVHNEAMITPLTPLNVEDKRCSIVMVTESYDGRCLRFVGLKPLSTHEWPETLLYFSSKVGGSAHQSHRLTSADFFNTVDDCRQWLVEKVPIGRQRFDFVQSE